MCAESCVKIGGSNSQRRTSMRNDNLHRIVPIKFRKLSSIKRRFKNRKEMMNAKEKIMKLRANSSRLEQHLKVHPQNKMIKRPQTTIDV